MINKEENIINKLDDILIDLDLYSIKYCLYYKLRDYWQLDAEINSKAPSYTSNALKRGTNG